VTAIESARTLRATWQADDALQTALDDAFDNVGFDADYVRSCVEAADAGTAQRKTKHIKDNVWGMVEIDGRTVRLLDCPIVQRLRGIKQLGFSYLTYPSAEHSRFIHSIGMACVVSRLLDSITKRAVEGREGESDNYVHVDELGPLSRQDIVHSAILHDVGHMPFSHATENVLMGHENDFRCGVQTVAELVGFVEHRLSKSLKFAEALSLLVILSKRFSNLYDRYVRYGSGDGDGDALLRIACLIAGLPPEQRLSGAAELISASVIDADKIDYVERDAYSCGIPVGVDVSRIFLRSGFLRVSRTSFKKRTQRKPRRRGNLVCR
jgi:deoxynucleoside triphosphate triphosphohydrolase SAMHD1